jgi:uncharacterized protein (DUF4415 family)
MNVKDSKKKSGTDWQFLQNATDDDIDFSDIPPLGPNFWKKAVVRMPQKKESLTLRLDHDVLIWFRGTGRGYQTKMNAILRSYMRSANDDNKPPNQRLLPRLAAGSRSRGP